jgi:hypothetical protein
MARSSPYPPHLQRAIDEAEAKRAKRGANIPTNIPAAQAAPATRRRGSMNKLERAYALHLTARVFSHEIVHWMFEGVRFRLANRAWYCPDFILWMPDGSMEAHETKGFMREAAAVRLKVAAEAFPHVRFVLVKAHEGQFTWQTIDSRTRAKEGARP